MEIVQHSLIGRVFLSLWIALATYYEHSVLAVLFRGTAGVFRSLWRGSLFSRIFSRESSLSKAWSRSLYCRFLGMILNLPVLLLRKLYVLLRPLFDGSIVAQLGFAIVENTPIAVSWLMFAILIIPYKAWNNAYSLLGFSLMLLFAILSGMRRKSRRLDVVDLGPYYVFFASLVILAVPLSAYTGLSARYLLYHLSCMLCVLVIVSTVERGAQLRRLASMASAGLVVVSAYGIVQRIQGVEVNPSFVDLTLNKDMPGRVYSMFENPNAFAEVLVLLIPLAIGLLFASKGWGGRLLGLSGALLGSVSILMTYSRASWIGLAVAVLVFLFLWKKKILPAVILLGLAAIPLLPDSIFNRILTIFNFSDTSTSSRFPLYEAAGRLISERPLQGVGLGSDAVRAAVADLNLYHGKSPFVHAHNVYLQVWAETGIFGLLSLLGTVGWALKRGGSVALRKIGSSSSRMLLIGSVSALVGIMVCGVADFIWHYPRVMLIFWFVFAMAASSIRVALLEGRQSEKKGLSHETI